MHKGRVTTSRLARLACILLGVLCAACKADDLVVEYREVEHRFSVTERRAIERITRGTVAEVRQLLTALPERIALRVDADDNVSAMTNAAGTAVAPDRIYWSVDPSRGGGVVATAEVHLRAMLFHELHHLVRDAAVTRVSLMDHVITEGMASAFERDHAGARYPFSEYPDDVAAWVAELAVLPGSADLNQWMFRHPDGRRWIGFRAGTYLVDRAMAASGWSSADLASTPTARVLELAGVEPAEPQDAGLSRGSPPFGKAPRASLEGSRSACVPDLHLPEQPSLQGVPAPQGFLGHLIAREFSQEECRDGEARSGIGGGGSP